MQRVLFLTKYSIEGASSRYRTFQYLPLLDHKRVQPTIQTLLPSEYLKILYISSATWTTHLARYLLGMQHAVRRWRYLGQKIQSFDTVFCEYELLPYFPVAVEVDLLRKAKRFVLDYDDAIYLNYVRLPRGIRTLLGDKVNALVRQCDHVIVANRRLEQWALQQNKNVTVIPTSINLAAYSNVNRPQLQSAPFVIGWIGTPVTATFLSVVGDALRRLAQRHSLLLRVIGAPDFSMEGVPVVASAWRSETEVADLQACHVGIMPLSDDAWAQGKSALKLLQYMAAGIAAVASPVGANLDVVTHGYDGLLAATAEEWETCLEMLIRRPDLRQTLATNGREKVRSQFSLEINSPRWQEVVFNWRS